MALKNLLELTLLMFLSKKKRGKNFRAKKQVSNPYLRGISKPRVRRSSFFWAEPELTAS